MGFRITEGKGFGITFKNGWSVSVQFGPGNYCENKDRTIGREDRECGEEGSCNAETALIDNKGKFIKYDGDDVQGWRTPEQVLELLNFAAKQEEKKDV